MRFYLGTHEPSWLARTDVPLFVSHRRLSRQRSFKRAVGRWALDSGGFSELTMYGAWETSHADYIAACRRYQDEIGGLDWVAPQDWMCEPAILARTGLSVGDHQNLTVRSVLAMRWDAPDVPSIPVLQGWHPDDYLMHVDRYGAAGIDLWAEPVIGVGSVCRRQSTKAIEQIVGRLEGRGLQLHGFGVKTAGMRIAHQLASADSMAWSYGARFEPPLPGHSHKTCANCMEWALLWREKVLAAVPPDPFIF